MSLVPKAAENQKKAQKRASTKALKNSGQTYKTGKGKVRPAREMKPGYDPDKCPRQCQTMKIIIRKQ